MHEALSTKDDMTEDMYKTIMPKDHLKNKEQNKDLQPYSGALQMCCFTEESLPSPSMVLHPPEMKPGGSFD